MTTFVAGPFFLVKPGEQIPPGGLTVSSCLAGVAPDTWALDWVLMDEPDRIAAAARCGIAEDQLPGVVAWATEHFDRAGFAWPNVLLNIETAREFRRRFLPQSFHLLQIYLPERLAESFLALAAPPPQQPGFAPVGATGVCQALCNPQLTETPGERRGFEVLGYDSAGGFDSFRCNRLERDFARLLDIRFNQWGLIEEDAAALQCAEYANRPDVGTCADAWHPWLVVEHAL